MEMKPVSAIIVGAGHRALVYSELAHCAQSFFIFLAGGSQIILFKSAKTNYIYS